MLRTGNHYPAYHFLTKQPVKSEEIAHVHKEHLYVSHPKQIPKPDHARKKGTEDGICY